MDEANKDGVENLVQGALQLEQLKFKELRRGEQREILERQNNRQQNMAVYDSTRTKEKTIRDKNTQKKTDTRNKLIRYCEATQ